MKIRPAHLTLLLAAAILTGCVTTKPNPAATAAPAAAGKPKGDEKAPSGSSSPQDDLDEYAVEAIPDPLEPMNRGTFWFNHQLYRYVLKPVSKGYETVVPKPVRTGLYNAFDNIEYPVRVVNHTLQGNLPRAGQETGKFAVNTVLGVGGIIKMSDKFPALADVPSADTGQTFARWGIPHGPYLVIPIIGPRSTRDTVGLCGDYALNPVTWLGIFYGMWAWTVPVSVADTVVILPDKMGQYDAATENAVDRYISVRTAYVQYRAEATRKAGKVSVSPAPTPTPAKLQQKKPASGQ